MHNHTCSQQARLMRDEFLKHRCLGQEWRRLFEAAKRTVSRSFLCLVCVVLGWRIGRVSAFAQHPSLLFTSRPVCLSFLQIVSVYLKLTCVVMFSQNSRLVRDDGETDEVKEILPVSSAALTEARLHCLCAVNCTFWLCLHPRRVLVSEN